MIVKVIKSLLDSNGDLNDLVPINNRYPYVINEGTSLPAVVYTIDSLSPEYDKDGWVLDTIEFSVVTFSNDYSSLQDIVAQVRLALELEKGIVEDITIERIYLTGQAEGYNIDENCFLSKLTFVVEVKVYE